MAEEGRGLDTAGPAFTKAAVRGGSPERVGEMRPGRLLTLSCRLECSEKPHVTALVIDTSMLPSGFLHVVALSYLLPQGMRDGRVQLHRTVEDDGVGTPLPGRSCILFL